MYSKYLKSTAVIALLVAGAVVEKQKMIAQVYSQVLTLEQRTKADQMRANHAQHIDQWIQHMTEKVPAKE